MRLTAHSLTALLLVGACESAASPKHDASATSSGGTTGAGDSGGPSGADDSGGTKGDSSGGASGETAGDAGHGSVPCDASAAPAVPALRLTPIVSGVSNLVYAAQPPGSSDWYLVRHTGQVMLFTGGALRATPFLDVSSIASATGNDERGLLGLAFSRDYASDGTFYVALTGSDNVDRVIERHRSAADPERADATARELLTLPASAPNHNGGTVIVGPDGLLYVGTGDGGAGCGTNQPGAAQSRGSLFGKILRLDPTKPAPHAAAGNPFADTGDGRVLHIGLRNPFRFGFDRLTGDLYIADVGQDQYEEVNFAAAGAVGLNFGWPSFEAATEGAKASCASAPALATGETHTPPIVVIEREAAPGASKTPDFQDYISVIGGFVYRGAAIPELRGTYLFGDYTGGALGALRQCGNVTSAVTTVWKNRNLDAPGDAYLARADGLAPLGALTAIVEGSDGEIYLVGNLSTLYKVVKD